MATIHTFSWQNDAKPGICDINSKRTDCYPGQKTGYGLKRNWAELYVFHPGFVCESWFSEAHGGLPCTTRPFSFYFFMKYFRDTVSDYESGMKSNASSIMSQRSILSTLHIFHILLYWNLKRLVMTSNDLNYLAKILIDQKFGSINFTPKK